MLGNDLSDDVPPLVLVHASAIYDRKAGLDRVLRLFTLPRITYRINLSALNYYDRCRSKGLKLQLFAYADDDWPMEDLWDDLEQYSSPFGSYVEFDNVPTLAEYLNYNVYIVGVVDPTHPMAFGSRSTGGYV